MTQYSGPSGSKKRRAFERCEAELLRALERGADEGELLDAAEALREAALAYSHSIGRSRSTGARDWLARSTEAIVDRYRKRLIEPSTTNRDAERA
jgi:hypothetical protein